VSGHPHGEVDYDKEYKVRDILDEKGATYLVDWEDDSETGEKFPPTWEPKKNVNELAVESWLKKQAAHGETKSTSSPTCFSLILPENTSSQRQRQTKEHAKLSEHSARILIKEDPPGTRTNSINATTKATTGDRQLAD
jgi:hypothetical protein